MVKKKENFVHIIMQRSQNEGDGNDFDEEDTNNQEWIDLLLFIIPIYCTSLI
jgi:hypothetical protein|tara:strand:- start:764 stop:919 length:156 start_codon:yes stop_codon:yes gene_type:complete